jgi:hypothetical protein
VTDMQSDINIKTRRKYVIRTKAMELRTAANVMLLLVAIFKILL